MKEASIEMIVEVTQPQLQLLHEADPNEQMITYYLEKGVAYQLVIEKETLAVIVLLPTRPATLEIVNLAVSHLYRNQGIATRLISFAIGYAKQNNYHTLDISTGSTSLSQLYLYQKCGFRFTYIEPDYFTTHYQEPIYENGLLLKDRVHLSQTL